MVSHMLISEDQKEECELSSKAKTMVTIKKVTNQLLNKAAIIRKTDIFKQGEGVSQKKERYGNLEI